MVQLCEVVYYQFVFLDLCVVSGFLCLLNDLAKHGTYVLHTLESEQVYESTFMGMYYISSTYLL